MTARYRVTAAMVTVKFARPQEATGHYKIGGGHFYLGELLPDNIDPVQLAHLADLGMIQPVQMPSPEPAEAA